MKRFSFRTSDLCLVVILAVAGVMLLPVSEAFAQSQPTGFGQVQRNVAGNIVYVPRFIAVLAYVIGAFFAATGLVKLKDWIADGNKNPLNPALFRIMVAALLISFPHMMVLVNSTLFGSQSNGDTQNVDSKDGVHMNSLNAFSKGN